MNRAQEPQRRGLMTPHLWGDQEAFSEEGIPEDDLKDEQGLARKAGRERGRGAHTWRWLVAVQGNPRGIACVTGKEQG